MWSNVLRTLPLAALVVLGVEAHAAQLVNGSFEQGSLNGWDSIGDTSAQTDALGVTPTHGNYAAMLTTTLPGTSKPQPYGSTPGVGLTTFSSWLGIDHGINPCSGGSNCW